MEGGSPTDLTAKDGIFYALEPDVRLDNEWYVFSCGFRDPETKATTWSICRASLKTGELINLNVDGWAPQWTPDGTAIVYNVEVEGNRQIKEMDPSGENQEALPLGEFDESTADGVSNVSIRQTSNDFDGLARIFQPALRFDEGERWRPLELDKMFEEIPPRVCIKKKNVNKSFIRTNWRNFQKKTQKARFSTSRLLKASGIRNRTYPIRTTTALLPAHHSKGKAKTVKTPNALESTTIQRM